MKSLVLLIVSFFSFFCSSAQDYTWWNDIHNWDGHTPWVQYMTISTSYLGPNALPVPEVLRGQIDSSAKLEAGVDYHFSKGDKTKDFYLNGFLPLFENRVAVSIDVIPYESFETNTITRDVRAARTRSGKGNAGGDIYFSTMFQLFKNKLHLPDLLFRATFRTASGTNLSNARYSDGPGYHFDVSAGKNLAIKKSILRIFLMGGFYVYQTYDLLHLQNDCIMYGGGTDLRIKNVSISQSLGGYTGYLSIGDKPLVYRASLKLHSVIVDWKLEYQWGIRDYDFQRIRAGIIVHPF